MMQLYDASLHLPVYSTSPDPVLPEAVRNAQQKHLQSARLLPSGNGFEGAAGGVPFPEPKSGLEVFFNHITRWRGLAAELRTGSAVVRSNGVFTLIERSTEVRFDYYLAEYKPESNQPVFIAQQSDCPGTPGGAGYTGA